jgi:hypothetical protein
MAAVVRSAGANTRPRREEKGGDGVLKHAREGEREGKERGHGGDGAPFISGHVGVGEDPRGDAMRRRGVGRAWGQRGGRAARTQEAHDRHRNRGEAMLTSEPRHINGR